MVRFGILGLGSGVWGLGCVVLAVGVWFMSAEWAEWAERIGRR